MCGILGIVSARGAPPAELLDHVGLLRHRGPDSEGRFGDGPVALAMRRLAIIDLDTGDQPVADERRELTCVVNGEIYNYVELRAELAGRGHTLATRGDVEVVPHLYEEVGDRCFERLRGMFAVALWDAPRRRLVLARDRFGIKPLYVAETPHGLAFSSEIRPLLSLGAPAEPDVQALADFLSLGYVPGEATGLLGVRAVAPGHVLVWEDGRVEERPFVDVAPAPAADLEETIAGSVRLHLRADVPLAVLLSGGLDSSLIASLAAEEAPALHTFTVGFGDAAFDELEPARAVARAIGSRHHEVEVRPDAAADLPELVARLEEPLADPSAIALYYVCRAAATEVKVALAGEGGDEVFGGYSRYAWDRYAAAVGRLPVAPVARALERALGARAARGGRKSLVRRGVKLLRHAGLPAAERYFAWFALLDEAAKAEVLAAGAREPTARVFEQALRTAPEGLTPVGRRQWVDLRTMLAKDLLLKADRMSMAHSLELRVPLLDNEVVAAGLALPDRAKVRGVETKRALRELVERRLGREIARRPKQGFEVPIDRWLREDLRAFAGDVLAPERLARRGLVSPAGAERLLRRHLSGEANLGLPVYALLVLELWLDSVEQAARVPAAA